MGNNSFGAVVVLGEDRAIHGPRVARTGSRPLQIPPLRPSHPFPRRGLTLLEKVAALTRSHGVPCQISLETHMACGVGACQGCAVKAASMKNRPYLHVCEDGPVFHAESLNWDPEHGSLVP